MSYLESILLGIIQGLTEFLPVSSSGHLVMLQHFMGLDPEKPAMIIFDLAVHLGTMVSVLVYYRRSISHYCTGLVKGIPQLTNPVKAYHYSTAIRLSVLAFCAILTTGIIYKLFGDYIKEGFENPRIVIICWLFTALVLYLTSRKRGRHISLKQFGILMAIVVGLAQGVALLPGVSRSGSTICAAVLLGLHRRWAGEFSFLIGVPAIAGASLLEGIQFFSTNPAGLAWGPTLTGSLVSCIVGFLALNLLMWMIRKAKLLWFSAYLVVISIVTAFFLLRGTIG